MARIEVIVRGESCTGKTTVLYEIRAALEKAGLPIIEEVDTADELRAHEQVDHKKALEELKRRSSDIATATPIVLKEQTIQSVE